MKINRIYIAAFGGLKNKTIDFKDGFSVIYGENENGKTTIMTFIKMMFYGSERGSSSIAKNPRKKYAPWSGEKSAGSIDFEHGGRSYRLEREFGNTNSSDKITLTDMSDGTRESLSGNVGERFFGLSAAAFERSVFVGQFGKAESDSAAESEINSKLSNMVTTGDESVSFAAVSDRLQKARFALLSKSGRAGECDKSKKWLAELESELERAEDIYERHAEYRKNADIINASIERDAERAAYLKAKIDSEQDIRNAERLKELLETKDKLERAKEELRLTNGGVIDDLYVGKVKMCLAKLDTAAEKLKDKTDEVQRLSVGIADAEDKGGREKIKNLEKEIADLDKKKTETENNISANKKAAEALRATESDVKRKKSGINVVFITAAGFALLAALLLFAFKMQSVALIPAAGAAVSALLSFILRPADKRVLEDYESRLKAFEAEAERLNADKTDVLQQLSLLSARLEAVNTSLGMGTAALENQKKLLLESRKAMEEAENTYKAAEKTLLELYGSYKPAQSTDEIRHELDTLAEKADGLKQIKQKLTYLAKDLGNISYDEARQKLEALPRTTKEIDFESIKTEYESLSEKLSENRSMLARAEAEDGISIKNAPDPERLKAEIKELTDKISCQEGFCRAADTALEALQDSFAELRGSYGSALEKRAGRIFSRLTRGAYGSVLITKAFDMSVEENGRFGSREAEYLSSGAADQAYLSLRLALSSMIFETSGALPIFLDDSLAQYDDRRAEAAAGFLKEYSADGQVIMFTCHGAVRDAAVGAGAAEIDLGEKNGQ